MCNTVNSEQLIDFDCENEPQLLLEEGSIEDRRKNYQDFSRLLTNTFVYLICIISIRKCFLMSERQGGIHLDFF